MGPFEMVVAIVAIVMFAGIIREFAKRRHDGESDSIQQLSDRVAKLESLEARVQTLETIVTDKKEDLKRKIDAL